MSAAASCGLQAARPGLWMQVAENLGLRLPMPEALALFSHHGFTTFIMPMAAFLELILPSGAAKATAEAPAKRRPFAAAAAAAPPAACKITYYPCKTPVFTPSRWRQTGQEAIERSGRVPDARLRLEFVYGYSGFNTTSCNLFYNCNREVRPPDHSVCQGSRSHSILAGAAWELWSILLPPGQRLLEPARPFDAVAGERLGGVISIHGIPGQVCVVPAMAMSSWRT